MRKSLEIQLEILFRFYDAHINNQQYQQHQFYADLKEKYSMKELDPHLITLIDDGFLRGKVTETNAGSIPFTTRIYPKGTRAVESIIDETVPQLDELKSSDFMDADGRKKFLLVREVWNNSKEIHKPIIQNMLDKLQEHFMDSSGSDTSDFISTM